MRSLLVALALITLTASAGLAKTTSPEKFVGDWEGKLDIGTPIRVVIHLAYADGKWSGTTDSPDQGGYGIALSEVTVGEKDLYWAVDAIDGEYRGTLSKDGKQIDGTLTQGGEQIPLTFARAAATTTPPATAATPTPQVASQPFAGDWAGALDAGAQKLRILLHLSYTGAAWGGSMESPDQGTGAIPLSMVSVDGAKVRVEVSSIGGVYEGTLNADGKSITGTWAQGGLSFPLNLARGDASTLQAPNRPQEPKAPLPYDTEEVSYPNPRAKITLAGTLTKPRTGGPFPVVLLITGSGPQDRDENVMTHKPFLVLSDYLTRQGIAVLRVDDRGVGKSTGNFAASTTKDFVDDVLAGVEYLKTRKDVNAKKIGLIGHSEGGIIAPIVASRSKDVSFIVMMAGVGVHADDLLVRQLSDLARVNGASDQVIGYVGAATRRMCQIAASPADSASVQKQCAAVSDSLKTQLAALDPTKAEMAGQQANGIAQLITSRWSRYLLTLRPEETLRNVKQPVLAINGSLDLQVSSKMNLPTIEKALKDGGNKDVTVQELPGLNHLFQTATTGSPMEYGKIEETISPVALKTMGDWIVARTSKK
ncbi:MAG TPA: alpha/beta fold hydrolase [Candidatus Krumholzibacteria bacterium]|nr:alpha/beta fold hydrolase [Candidatus Krumholzibacteria bacterium]